MCVTVLRERPASVLGFPSRGRTVRPRGLRHRHHLSSSCNDDGMSAPQPKRAGPPQVDPVLQGALRFEVLPWGRERGLAQNGGLIAAYDPETNKELWTLQVYTMQYDGALEEDAQDVFIVKLAAGPGPEELTVVDERGRTYRVDTRSRNARLVESTQ